MATRVELHDGDVCPLCERGALSLHVTLAKQGHAPEMNHYCSWCGSVVECIIATGYLTSAEWRSAPLGGAA